MASWRAPAEPWTLELDETHKHATVVELLRHPARAAQSGAIEVRTLVER